jgi:hypothetical protein
MSSENEFETVSRAASNLKTIIGLGVGLVVGAFLAGFTLKKQYEDLSTSYRALLALQENKWGVDPGDGPAATGGGVVNSLCPDGSYMVGIRTISLGSIGGTIVPRCRRLKLQ